MRHTKPLQLVVYGAQFVTLFWDILTRIYFLNKDEQKIRMRYQNIYTPRSKLKNHFNVSAQNSVQHLLFVFHVALKYLFYLVNSYIFLNKMFFIYIFFEIDFLCRLIYIIKANQIIWSLK